MKYLWECKTLKEQKRWCLKKLQADETLNEHYIWFGGANPDEVINSLRQDGVDIESCTTTLIDAAGIRHEVSAWRIK